MSSSVKPRLLKKWSSSYPALYGIVAFGWVSKNSTFTANPAISTGNFRLDGQESKKPTTFPCKIIYEVTKSLHKFVINGERKGGKKACVLGIKHQYKVSK
jgi:hypothetical protein